MCMHVGLSMQISMYVLYVCWCREGIYGHCVQCSIYRSQIKRLKKHTHTHTDTHTDSPRRTILWFVYHRHNSTTVPYTSTSLKRKNTLGWTPRRLRFDSWPSPTSTLPGVPRDLAQGPNELATALMRARLTLVNAGSSAAMT